MDGMSAHGDPQKIQPPAAQVVHFLFLFLYFPIDKVMQLRDAGHSLFFSDRDDLGLPRLARVGLPLRSLKQSEKI